MHQSSVVFGGTARGVETYIKRVLGHIETCGKLFKQFHVVIYENNSSDNTVSILEAEKKPNYKYIYESSNEKRRTVRLAHGRNQILKEVMAINPDYFVMLDLDDVNASGAFVESINTCFNENKDWAVLTGNQHGFYYDMWALRMAGVMEVDCWKQYFSLHKSKRESYENQFKSMTITGDKWLPVDSAFGGIALYKTSALQNCLYEGAYPDGSEICEHVLFHAAIRQGGGKIYINPLFFTN
jgi:glycosyltransferase involved in cell wall biosynthesis